ncbi:hypothetical protein [Hymenobacter sp. B1770]|uniref:hypothetical protein n=1 Tax=Hymenobacter sp. B1770 TaxID=1718788 RepID=UPI003CF43D4A
MVPPVAMIGIIERGNKGYYNPALSLQGQSLMRETLLRYRNELHLTGELTLPDSLTYQRLVQQLYRTLDVVEQQRFITSYHLPTLDSLLKQQGSRYALLTTTEGFTRVGGNYGNQVAKAVGVGILTLGLYSPVPIKANSGIALLVYDCENRSILYYKRAWPKEVEPLDALVLDRQLRAMLAKDFRFAPRP